MSLLEPPTSLLKLLHESLPKDAADSSHNGKEEILAYTAFLAAGLAELQEFEVSVWKETLTPYLEQIGYGDDIIETYCYATQKEFSDDDDASSYGDPDEDVEELCNIRFNLAYGGKILLHQTKLRLLRGRRYALVGQNGVGKTTLMNAINNGKLEGWPEHLVTAYVDSGSNVDPEYEKLLVLPHLMESTKRLREECAAKLKELDFTDAMMEGNIGSLSGGWQMKLRLVRAGKNSNKCSIFSKGSLIV